ncbi:MAG: VanW family protein [Acidobacteria bacterium]|nr:VanW family protein [Acidobacteriota bacterium]
MARARMTDPQPPQPDPNDERRRRQRERELARQRAAAEDDSGQQGASEAASGRAGGSGRSGPSGRSGRPDRQDGVPRARRAPGVRMRAIVIGAGAVLIILVILLIAGGGGGTAPGTTVAGVDMGGDEAEVRAAVARRADELLRRRVQLQAGGGTVATVRLADIGATVDVDAAIREAQDSSPNRLVRGLKAVTGQSANDIPLRATYRKGALAGWVADVSDNIDRPEQDAAVLVRGTTFTVEPAEDGRALDRAALGAAVSGDLAAMPGVLALPLKATKPALSTDAARQQVAQAGEVIRRGTNVVVDDVQATLPPDDVARAMRFTPEGLRIAASELRKPLLAAYPKGSVVPSPARFDIRGKKAILIPSKTGRLVDAKRVADGLMGEDRPVESSFTDVTPVFTTEKAQSLGIKEEVGSFTTPYTPGEARVTNIRRASTILNGVIIPAGGSLSLNNVLGRRTEARGFVPAPMLADGLHVDAVGGGVSQVATTLFNAAFFAGFELNEHTAHQLYIDRYPEGREATVSWPTPDLKITNNWDAAALVRVWNGADSITVALYSTSFDRKVETETSERADFTKPDERRVTDAGVTQGEVVSSEGGEGFSVRVSRKVYKGSELVSDDVFTTTYLAPPKIILVPEGTPGAETLASPDG